jgi:hypothetical protein
MASVSVAFVSFNESRNRWTCLLRVAALKAVHKRFFRDVDWKLMSNFSTIAINSYLVSILLVCHAIHDAYCDFDATMIYTLYCTVPQRIFVGFNSLKHRDEELQIFFDRCDFVWSIFNRPPKTMKLDARFSKLNPKGNNPYTFIQSAGTAIEGLGRRRTTRDSRKWLHVSNGLLFLWTRSI